ncbi:MAG: hypothetical protein JO051_04125 [Acidobacteriaceae bacterium]|nr:hypothetical protein [Acidobacteriaceae bacterium]
MPEIRELILRDHMGASLFRLPVWGKLACKLKLALRRFVVATGGSFLAVFYHAVYKAHVWHALRTLKRLPGTRSIYVSRGLATGAIVYGVSDVDLVVLGEWSDAEHAEVMKQLRKLSRSSPLYDACLWQHAHTFTALGGLYATDFYYQFRFDQGRSQWKLLYGEDFLATLPPVPAVRIVPGYYMDMRNWWDTFTKSVFGDGVTATDLVFRNSIAYKAVGEIVNKSLAFDRGSIQHDRSEGIQLALEKATGEDRDFLLRLQQSAAHRHLRYSGDIQDDSFRYLLRLLENFHSKIGAAPGCQPLPGVTLEVDASPDDLLLSKSAQTHASEVTQRAKQAWPGYRGAFLLPTLSSFNLDDLLLLIQIDPRNIPPVREIRELCLFHAHASKGFTQRIALLLLLEQGAYQLETVGFLELWHLLVCPAANPDIFALLNRPGFLLDGSPAANIAQPGWTQFAAALIDEEIAVRRAAMSAVNADVTLTPLELLRNLWRQLQIELIHRSQQSATVLVPMTPRAIRRALVSYGANDTPALATLEAAYRSVLDGESTDFRSVLPEVFALISNLPPRQP